MSNCNVLRLLTILIGILTFIVCICGVILIGCSAANSRDDCNEHDYINYSAVIALSAIITVMILIIIRILYIKYNNIPKRLADQDIVPDENYDFVLDNSTKSTEDPESNQSKI
jgi:uncharacterized membrane protein